MANITTLPCEVVASILRHLGNVSSLLPSLLTCRHIYTSFKENPSLGADVLERQIGPKLLPYATAVLEASRLDSHTETDLLKALYTQPAQLTGRLRTTPLPILIEMGRLYNVIHALAVEFASRAWELMVDDEGLPVSGALSLSPREHFRFCRAFYRAELYVRLFRRDSLSTVDLTITELEKEWFFLRHPPWENEQLGCVHDFLELKVAKASHDALAHDVYFGELGIDYLSTGDNYHRQAWISQGIQFVHRFANEPSYDARKEIIEAAFSSPMTDLYDTMVNLFRDDHGDQVPLAECTDEELARLLPAPCDRDTDKGPYEAWRVAFGYMHGTQWVMMTDHAWLRERAYVLWDMRRLEEYGMLEVIENAPEDSALIEAEKDLEDMQESFVERSRIWNKGGRGYWSKGDTSKIVWPE